MGQSPSTEAGAPCNAQGSLTATDQEAGCPIKGSFLDANDATLIEHVSCVWSVQKLISLF